MLRARLARFASELSGEYGLVGITTEVYFFHESQWWTMDLHPADPALVPQLQKARTEPEHHHRPPRATRSYFWVEEFDAVVVASPKRLNISQRRATAESIRICLKYSNAILSNDIRN